MLPNRPTNTPTNTSINNDVEMTESKESTSNTNHNPFDFNLFLETIDIGPNTTNSNVDQNPTHYLDFGRNSDDETNPFDMGDKWNLDNNEDSDQEITRMELPNPRATEEKTYQLSSNASSHFTLLGRRNTQTNPNRDDSSQLQRNVRPHTDQNSDPDDIVIRDSGPSPSRQ